MVEYDRDRGTIELGDAVTEARMLREYVPEDDIPWCYYYLGLTAVLGGIIALTGLGVHPFSELSTVAFGTIATVSSGPSAAIHTIHARRNEIGSNVRFDE